jgi:hypothetical protein
VFSFSVAECCARVVAIQFVTDIVLQQLLLGLFIVKYCFCSWFFSIQGTVVVEQLVGCDW